MTATCAFCGSDEPLTREHVFGQWLSKIGLPMEKSAHVAGALNRLGRDMGVRPPFTQTVKSFCGTCNNGWMSRLETEAQRILTPLIRDESGWVEREDLVAVALWAHKTALTAMLVSSEKERAEGHGVPESEYRALYTAQAPLPYSRFWAARYEGRPFWGARVVPLSVRPGGVAVEDLPQGYAMTIVVGALVLHGIRYTSPELAVDVESDFDIPTVWPPLYRVPWPTGDVVTDRDFLYLANGQAFLSDEPAVEVIPWESATSLAPSTWDGQAVRLPVLCGRHWVGYPGELVREAQHGRYYYFATACECPKAYLIETRADGAHCIAADDKEEISALYESLPGEERAFESFFTCKVVAAPGA